MIKISKIFLIIKFYNSSYEHDRCWITNSTPNNSGDFQKYCIIIVTHTLTHTHT